MDLNQDLEVVAIEAIAQCRILLTQKGTDLNEANATCLAIRLHHGRACPTERLELIAREATFNCYDFIDTAAERASHLMLLKPMLSNEAIFKINSLFADKSSTAI